MNEYKRVFPEDYENTKEALKIKRDLQKDKFSEIKGAGYIQRPLIEWPEILFGMLENKLSSDEWKEIFDNKDHKMINWCADTLKEFRIAEKI